MTTVGGVTIGLGVDITQVGEGFSKANSMLRRFQGQMASIKLEGIIKGDPFSATRKYMDASQKQLDRVFSSWSDRILKVDQDYNKFAESSRMNTEKLVKDYEKVAKKFKILQGVTSGAGKTPSEFWQSLGFGETVGGPKTRGLKDWFKLAEEDLNTFMGAFKALSPRARKIVDDFFKRFNSGIKTNSKNAKHVLAKYFGLIKKEVIRAGEDIIPEYKKFGEQIRKAQMKMTGLRFGGELDVAGSDRAAVKRRSEATRKLRIEEARLNAEIRIGMNVSKNRIALAQNYQRRQELGITLTRKQKQALEKYRKEQDKLAKGEQLFTREWFTKRARWFVQLRAFWAIWRGAGEAVREAFEFEQEMANVRAIAQTTSEQFEQLKEAALDVGRTTRFSAKEAAEGMVTMSQAGMTADEILGSIKDTAMLATATLYDFKETAGLITTVMRAWEKDASDVKEITDVLATATNESRLTMSSLANAFNYISGIAPQLEISLQETTALLGTMANRGLSSSTMATSLRAALSALLRPTERFKDELRKTGLTVDDVNPELYDVTTIFKTLKDAGWGAEEAFRAFRRRAASGISVLIRNADSLEDMTDRMYQHNRAQEMARINLETVQGQWKQFNDTLVAFASEMLDRVNPALFASIRLLKGLVVILSPVINGLASLLGMIGKVGGYTFDILSGNFKNVGFREFIEVIRKARDEVKDLESEVSKVVEDYRKMRDAYRDFRDTIEEALWRGGKSAEDLFGRALRIAEDAKLITEEEMEKYEGLLGDIEIRRDLEETINKKFEERKKALASEHKQLKQNIELSKRYAFSLLLPGVREAIKDYEDIISRAYHIEGEFESWPHQSAFPKLSKGPERPELEFKGERERLMQIFSEVGMLGPEAIKYMEERVEGFKKYYEAIIRAQEEGKTLFDIITEGTDKTSESLKVTKKDVEDFGKVAGEVGDRYWKEEQRRELSRLELRNILANEGLDIQKRINAAKELESRAYEEVLFYQERLRNMKSRESRVYADEEETLKEINKYTKERSEYINKIFDLQKEVNKEGIENYNTVIREQKAAITRYKANISSLDAMKDIERTAKSIAHWNEEIKDSEIRIALATKEISFLTLDQLDKEKLSIKLTREGLEQEKEKYKVLVRDAQFDEEKQRLRRTLISINSQIYNLKKREEEVNDKIYRQEKLLSTIEENSINASKERLRKAEETLKLAIEEQRIEKLRNENSMKAAELDRKIEDLKETGKDVSVEILGIELEKLKIRREELKTIIDIRSREKDIKQAQLELYQVKTRIKALEEEKRLAQEIKDLKELELKFRRLIRIEEEKLTKLEKSGASTEEKAKQEKKILDLQMDQLRLTYAITSNEAKRREIFEDIADLNVKIRNEQREQYLLEHPMEAALIRMKDEAKSINELFQEITYMSATGIGEGMGDIAWDWASGFQEAKNKGAELKGELDELENEYKILSEHELLSQDDVDRMKEIEGEMSELRDEIRETESATNNLKESIKSWAKNMIDEIGRVITRWLAMEMVMGAMELFGPSTTPNLVVPGGRAHGGILPQIKSFREFSNGGITGRPTLLALAGDNKSGRELIIPEENIKSNEVSGYMRRGGDIYIANYLTEQDVAAAMAGKSGKNVILNHVIEAKDKKGAAWRRI